VSSSERDAVADHAHGRLEECHLAGLAVEPPPALLVEAPGARVVLEHPEDRLREALAAKALQQSGHEGAAVTGAPGLRQHVDGVELAQPHVILGGPAAREPADAELVFCDEHVGSRLGLVELPAPADHPPFDRDAAELLRREDVSVGALPCADVDVGDRLRVVEPCVPDTHVGSLRERATARAARTANAPTWPWWVRK